MFSLDDEKSKKLGEVISSASCKRIVSLLAEKELSETDISRELRMPLNTVEYNLKKLIEAGIIEKASKWWSIKGRKIDTYRVANKLIVISPKKNVSSKLKSVIPIVAVTALLSFFIYLYTLPSGFQSSDMLKSAAPGAATSGASEAAASTGGIVNAVSNPIFLQPWVWFLLGSLVAVVLFLIIKWKKL